MFNKFIRSLSLFFYICRSPCVVSPREGIYAPQEEVHTDDGADSAWDCVDFTVAMLASTDDGFVSGA